jgi:hypothetical protein
MRSNLCRRAGLLSLLFLTATLGSFGYGERDFKPWDFTRSSVLTTSLVSFKLVYKLIW